MEGAIVTPCLEGGTRPARDARDAAAPLIDRQ